jgi:hypothetical protein
MDIDKDTFSKFLLSISESYQDTMNLRIKNILETNQQLEEYEGERLINYEKIFQIAHIVYIKKRNPKAKELVDILVQFLDPQIHDQVNNIEQLGENLFKYSNNWTKIDEHTLQVLEGFFGISQGRIIKQMQTINIFETLFLKQRMDMIQSLLSYLTEWVETKYSNMSVVKMQKQRSQSINQKAGISEGNKAENEVKPKNFEEFINELRIILKETLSFIENKTQWVNQYSTKADYSNAKKIFSQQFFKNQKHALKISKKFNQLRSEQYDIDKELNKTFINKLLNDLEVFMLILSGPQENENEREYFITSRYNKEPMKLLIAFLTTVNPLLKENESQFFFNYLENQNSSLLNDSSITCNLVLMIRSKSDAHQLIQNLISEEYYLMAFLIGKLTFFSDKLKPVTITREFGNKQYLAYLTDKLLDYFLKIEIGFNDFFSYYNLTYNLEDKLNTMLLLKCILINLHDLELPLLCSFNPILNNIFQKALQKFFNTYSVETDSENSIFKYSHEYQLESQHIQTKKELQFENFLMFMAYSQNQELSEIILEIIFKKKWLDTPNASYHLLKICLDIRNQINKPKFKSNSTSVVNKKLSFRSIQNRRDNENIFNNYKKELEQINKNRAFMNNSIKTTTGLKSELINSESKYSQFDKLIIYLQMRIMIKSDGSNLKETLDYISSFINILGPKELLFQIKMILFLKNFFSENKNYIDQLEYDDKEEIIETLLESFGVWRNYFEIYPQKNLVFKIVDEISNELHNMLL